MSTPPAPHFVRFARAIALAGSLGSLAGCGASTTPVDGDLECVCCPTGDISGLCSTSPGPTGGAPRPPMQADASSGEAPPADGGSDFGPPGTPDASMPTNLTPPAGRRWCTGADITARRASCPVAGPLNPPELDDALA
jgi:hypothetical protein